MIPQDYRRLIALIKHPPRTNRGGARGGGPDRATECATPIPASVRRQAALADALISELSAGLPRRKNTGPERPMVMWVTNATVRRRQPHRRTDKPRGRPRKNENDKAAEAAFGAAIAAAIDQLVRLRGMKKTGARRLVAATLSDHAFKNAYAAVQKLTDPATRRAVHQGECSTTKTMR